ncbi:hypothetical protein BU24DRAFT_426256 [Aaosphaeria arxii CBS 175.79]|uniref:Uncharacterized protein n=1 Tax=Aaosphaeria arxii CBS 175.79 TaxID=1450172 RepID=A0A6A5XHD7_9PLEO|nr:uncharacterized protein BU24DRAFT_426256 [Aaosphaeria arxii CBS 175.79]KAF2012373.1 hypothetical protein BU24DRAFT_426256 [Aaosphaeria arxii CBS 175.79]
MSSSIAIPQRKKKQGGASNRYTAAASSSTTNSSNSPFAYGSYSSNMSTSPSTPPSRHSSVHNRRPSLMSPSFSEAEYTVVNIGNSESPRLVSCIKASQGFHWNQEIFLPSYADVHFEELERKQDPVQDIFVSDEEVAQIFPQ